MKQIPLTRNKFALVDDEDYDFLMQWKWFALKGHQFYAVRTITIASPKIRKHLMMHRIIMNVNDDQIIVDHKNRNTLDNQKHNLRECTKSQNNKNTSSRINSTSKFLGVSAYLYRKEPKYVSQILHQKTKINLGYFPYTPEGEIKAAKAYDNAAKRYHGEFANLNFKD